MTATPRTTRAECERIRDVHAAMLTGHDESVSELAADYLAALDVLRAIVAMDDAPTDAQSLLEDAVDRAAAFIAATDAAGDQS